MDIHLLKDDAPTGSWVMILGCPMPEKHGLKDKTNGLNGPSFATCAECEHQIGEKYQMMGADGNYDGTDIFPERLVCGIQDTNSDE